MVDSSVRPDTSQPCDTYRYQVDVAVVGIAEGSGKPPLLAIGEAKWNDVMGFSQRGHAELAHGEG